MSNNASYTQNGLPGYGIAQGSIAAIFGTNLGPAQLQQANFALPTALAGTSVRIQAQGTAIDAYLLNTSVSQLAIGVPSNTLAGSATLTVTYRGTASQAVPVEIVPGALGIFTLNGAGNGPEVVTDANYQP